MFIILKLSVTMVTMITMVTMVNMVTMVTPLSGYQKQMFTLTNVASLKKLRTTVKRW